jgi:DNA adenine methylase
LKRWTKEEVAILYNYYSKSPKLCYALLLPGRSLPSVYAKAHKLGLKKQQKEKFICSKPIKPPCKWAGGKTRLLKDIHQSLPKKFKKYFEPFVGGGSVILSLLPESGVIGDINAELINTYKVIKSSMVHQFLKEVKSYQNTAEYFYRVRALDPKLLGQIERAARFMYLNKTCFNGLWRENNKGEFNVPFGKYKSFSINEREILLLHGYLNQNSISIVCADYQKTLKGATKGDLVYLDPPYDKEVSSSFTKYTKEDFTKEDQIKLKQVVDLLTKKGVYVILSNANTDFIRNLYKDYAIKIIEAGRSISSKGNKRGKSPIEVIITNFGVS